MTTSRFLSALSLGLAATLWSSVAAQTAPPGQHLPALAGAKGSGSSIFNQSCGLAAEGGVLRGHGAGYKATFDRGGIEYTPALGAQATHSYPLRFTLEEIRRSGTVVSRFAAADAATPARRAGECAVYDRGSGIAERYAVRAEGVELSFVFPAPPPGQGDLVVRGRIDTELHPSPSQDAAQGLCFTAEGLGGVRIGAVTGIDAEGRRAAGTLHLDGVHLELVLPAAFVDHAAYPLVLDPLLGTTFLVGGSTSNDGSPDVAYDVANDLYLVVWQRTFSATDQDIRAQRVDSSGTLVGSLIPVTTALTSELSPTVGHVNLTGRFLVAWFQQVGAGADIWGLCVDPASGAMSSATALVATSAYEGDPDAGSETTMLDDEAILVWGSNYDVMVAEVTCPVAGPPFLASPPAVVFSYPTIAGLYPSVSQNGGATGRHVVAYSVYVPGGNQTVHAVAVDRNASLLGASITVQGSSYAGVGDVDGDGTSFMVAYSETEQVTGPKDVYCRMLRYDATSGGLVLAGATTTVASDPNDDEHSPTVAFLGPKYVVAWCEETIAPIYGIGLRELDPAGCTACGPELFVGGSRPTDSSPRIAAQLAGGAASDAAMLVFSSSSSSPPYAGEITAQRLKAIGSGGSIVDAGGGCGAGGTAFASGSFAIGNPNFQLHLGGADFGATVAALVVNGVVPPIVCGPCTITPPLISISRPIAQGAAYMPIPLPCDMLLLGAAVEVQWWVVVPGGPQPCVLGPNLSFSNRLQATLGL